MTTIVGIASYRVGRTPAVVLASDCAITYSNIDGTYRVDRKPYEKIKVDSRQEFAVATAGKADEGYTRFLGSLVDGQIDLRPSIDSKVLAGLAKLNDDRNQLGVRYGRDITKLVLATRFDGKPRLFNCHQYGTLDERSIVVEGSGSNYALEEIERAGTQKDGISLGDAVRLVDGAIMAAEKKDKHTRGINMAIIIPDGIIYCDNLLYSNQRNRSVMVNRIATEIESLDQDLVLLDGQ